MGEQEKIQFYEKRFIRELSIFFPGELKELFADSLMRIFLHSYFLLVYLLFIFLDILKRCRLSAVFKY